MKIQSWIIVAGLFGILAVGCKSDADGWPEKKLVTVQDKVSGIGFTIQMPEGMKKSEYSNDVTLDYQVAEGDEFMTPHFAVSYAAIPPKTLDKAVENMMASDKETISRKEVIEGGFIVTKHGNSKGLVQVHVWKPAGDKTLSARCSQAKNGGLPDFDKTKAWLEKVCLTLTYKP